MERNRGGERGRRGLPEGDSCVVCLPCGPQMHRCAVLLDIGRPSTSSIVNGPSSGRGRPAVPQLAGLFDLYQSRPRSSRSSTPQQRWPSKMQSKEASAKPKQAGMQAVRGTWCHGAQFHSPRAGAASTCAAANEVCVANRVGMLQLTPYEATTDNPPTTREWTARSSSSQREGRSSRTASLHRTGSLQSTARSVSRSVSRSAARVSQRIEMEEASSGGRGQDKGRREQKWPTIVRHVKVTSSEIGQASWNQRLKANEIPNYNYPSRPLPSDGVQGYTYGDVEIPGKADPPPLPLQLRRK